MRVYTIITILFAILFSGCAGLGTTKRLETVIDRVYIPKECPTFTHQLNINGKKYIGNNDVSETTVIIPLNSFVEELERNKLARNEFNKVVSESNQALIVEGVPQTNNFKRVEKRVFVNRECPKFYYAPNFKAKKLLPEFVADANTTYVIITLDEMVVKTTQNKMAREAFNTNVDEINAPSVTETAKKYFDETIELTLNKIDDTANEIKKMAGDKVVKVITTKAKEAVFSDTKNQDANTTK